MCNKRYMGYFHVNRTLQNIEISEKPYKIVKNTEKKL